MAIKFFPKALYKGDSINIPFEIKDRNTGELYEFQPGDILKVGIKETLESTEYQIFKTMTITTSGTKVMIQFTPEETDKLTVLEDKAILEVRLTYNGGASRSTTYQKVLRLEGVVIDE